MTRIECTHIAATAHLHHPRDRTLYIRTDQQMDVVGHQHVTVDGHAVVPGRRLQNLQITGAILVIKEARSTVNLALGDVQWNTGKFEPGTTHG